MGGWVIMWSGSCGVEHAVLNSHRTDHNRGTGGWAVGDTLKCLCEMQRTASCVSRVLRRCVGQYTLLLSAERCTRIQGITTSSIFVPLADSQGDFREAMGDFYGIDKVKVPTTGSKVGRCLNATTVQTQQVGTMGST